MNKKDFFKLAMSVGMYKYHDWVLSAFAVFDEDPEEWKKNPYPCRIVIQDSGKYFYVEPQPTPGDVTVDAGVTLLPKLLPIEGATAKEPLFAFKDKVSLKAGDCPNLKKDVETTYGNWLFNMSVLVFAFNDKIDYVEGKVKTAALEEVIAKRLESVPEEGAERRNDVIYVDELLKYGQAMGALDGYSNLCVPTASERTVTPNAAILKRRDELIIEYKDQLKDPAVIAKIEKELTDMFVESLKGDPAEGFFINDKTTRVTLKKLYIMHGAEFGFGASSADVETITTSLSEGWDIEKIPAYVNSLRSGSHNRGSQTELGGEAVKTFHRIFQNTRIAEEDCGVKHGMKWSITEDNYKDLVGQNMVVGDGKFQQLSEDYLKSVIGKTIEIRTPMLCKTQEPSFCAICMGEKYGRSPTGLGVSAAEVGSVFMTSFMGAMHAKALVTVPLNLKQSIT